MSATCGGCEGLGAHGKFCPRSPTYHPWKRLAAQAESIGDSIGSNEPGIANRAYALSSAITAAMADHPFRSFAAAPQSTPTTESKE